VGQYENASVTLGTGGVVGAAEVGAEVGAADVAVTVGVDVGAAVDVDVGVTVGVDVGAADVAVSVGVGVGATDVGALLVKMSTTVDWKAPLKKNADGLAAPAVSADPDKDAVNQVLVLTL